MGLIVRGLIALGFVTLCTVAAPIHPVSAMTEIGTNPQMTEFLARSALVYSEAPDISNCRAGKLTDAEKAKAVSTLNTIRELHGLSPVIYDPQYDDDMMQAALMIASNRQLSHNPPPTWNCYTANGARMAGMSNIMGGIASPYLRYYGADDDVIGWTTDVGNLMAGVGHRRWLLDPFLQKISFGMVSARYDSQSVATAALIKIMETKTIVITGSDKNSPIPDPQIIAYPQGNYPVRFYEDGALLSVSLLTDTNRSFLNKADFSNAIVEIQNRNGRDLPVTNIHADNFGFGLPNNIYFSAGALERDVIYDVKIHRVLIAGKETELKYWFRLVS